MSSGTVVVNLRPLKLAFAVDPRDHRSVLAALIANSFLWGGPYNPLVPVFSRIPRGWKERFGPKTTAKDVLQGYISAYDPDFLVSTSANLSKHLEGHAREIIQLKDIFPDSSHEPVQYGVSLGEILRTFAHDEMRFKRRSEIKMLFPESKRNLALFAASVFGQIPKKFNRPFDNAFRKFCNIEHQELTYSNYPRFLDSQNLFPRRIASFHIRRIPPNNRFIHYCIFFFDAENTVDVVDFWNLRALGLDVIPAPQQACGSPAFLKYILNFIDHSFREYRHSPGFYESATLIRGAYSSDKLFSDFLKLLQLSPRKVGRRIPELTFQPWYPRIWDDWGRKSDSFECSTFQCESQRHPIAATIETVSVSSISPKFAEPNRGLGSPRFANALELRIYGTGEPMAEILPESDRSMARALDALNPSDWRFSSQGAVYLCSLNDWPISFKCPTSEAVFSQWMQGRGWEVSLSPSGRIAQCMLKQLGGVWGIGVLAKSGMVDLLCDLGGGKVIVEGELRGQLKRLTQPEKYGWSATSILNALTSAHALALGVQLQCPTCSMRSWYSANQLNDVLKCQNCFSSINLPTHNVKEMPWAYRTLGPFALPSASFGAYCVLLTLRYLTQCYHLSSTPMLSFNAKQGNEHIEADLGLFLGNSILNNNLHQLVFAECKTRCDFEPKDTSRMHRISAEFPGATLVFATLKSSLSVKEKRILQKLVIANRRSRLIGKPSSVIIILTRNELTSDVGPVDNWEKLSVLHKSLRDSARRDLSSLADATQQLYLELDSFAEWILKNRPRRKTSVASVNTQQSPRNSNAQAEKIYLNISTRMREVRSSELMRP